MELHYSTIFEANADAIGEEIAIKQGSVSRTWADFDNRASRFAGAMLARGLTKGSRIGQLLYNSPELLETYHGSLKIRAVPFNINYRYTAEEVLYILDNAEAEALVFHSSLSTVVADVLPKARTLKIAISVDDGVQSIDVAIDIERLLADASPSKRIVRDPDDPTMIYTGGTTGAPKGVWAPIRPHLEEVLRTTPGFMGEAAINDPVDVAALAVRLRKDKRHTVGLPLSPMVHGAALNIVGLPALIMGGTVILATRRHFDPAEAWTLVESERVNSMTIVGDAFARPLLDELRNGPVRDLSSLHVLSSAGAIFSSDIKTALLGYMRPDSLILDFISATEAAMGISIATRDRPAETGLFKPNPGVLVLSDDNRPVAPGSGQSGRIAVPSPAFGYLKDDAKNASTFPEISGQRYAIPGDYALVEADGSLRLLGRGWTCINTGGLKVFPDEVEEVLKLHPSVKDAVVLGLPDERFGQRVAALLAVVDGTAASEDEVLAMARQKLAGFKLPKTVRFVPEIPRTNVGKHDYVAARKMFE